MTRSALLVLALLLGLDSLAHAGDHRETWTTTNGVYTLLHVLVTLSPQEWEVSLALWLPPGLEVPPYESVKRKIKKDILYDVDGDVSLLRQGWHPDDGFCRLLLSDQAARRGERTAVYHVAVYYRTP